MSTTIPQELVEIIIDYLYSDKDALTTCSLVSRSWVPSSRFHLFELVRFGLPLVITPKNFEDILDLVDVHYSTISPYLRSLILKDWISAPGSARFIFDALIPRLTARMGAVEKLCLDGTSWDAMGIAAKKSLLKFGRLKELELWNCHCQSLESLLRIIYAFPSIEKISIVKLARTDRSLPPRTNRRAVPHLRSIHVNASLKEPFFKWLLSLRTLPPIEDVSLGAVLPGEARPVGMFLRALGSRLRHLTISGGSIPDVPFLDLNRYIRLEHNKELVSFHINVLLDDGDGEQGSEGWFLPIMSTIHSANLQSVIFTIQTCRMRCLRTLDWIGLRNLLDSFQFMGLDSVDFFVFPVNGGKGWDGGFPQEAEEMIRRKLSESNARGQLHLHFSSTRNGQLE